MNRREIPNVISILRILLVVPIVWLLLDRQYGLALVLFAIAGISDGLDGFLAKHYGWESRLGAMLDPLADKILLVSSYVVLAWLDLIPVWLLAAVILRDVTIVIGAVVYHHKIASVEAAPTLISKLNTLAQILLVVAVVFDQGAFALPAGITTALIYTVLVTTVWSGSAYVWVWGRRAWKSWRPPMN